MRPADAEATVRALSPSSYGHTGFVGNSLWVDPERQLVAAVLTNNVFFGRHDRQIMPFRRRFHDTLINALETN